MGDLWSREYEIDNRQRIVSGYLSGVRSKARNTASIIIATTISSGETRTGGRVRRIYGGLPFLRLRPTVLSERYSGNPLLY